MKYLQPVLSTYARNDNEDGRRRTAVLRRQSDDRRRIDRDALGRFGGGDRRVLAAQEMPVENCFKKGPGLPRSVLEDDTFS